MKVEFVLFDTYIQVVKNSIGTKIFQNNLANVDGEITDITKNGELSCSFFVSSVLSMFNLISSTHATVSGLEKDLLESGWRKSNELNKGSIIIWKETDQGGEIHRHSGFFMGNNIAISNSTVEKVPIEHHHTYNNTREIEAVYWSDCLPTV